VLPGSRRSDSRICCPIGVLDAAAPAASSMTSQGTARGRFSRFIKQRNLFAVEIAIREMGTLSLLDALGYLDLLSEANSAKLERAALRWHGRLETEAPTLTLAESQLRAGGRCEPVRWRARCAQDPSRRAPTREADAPPPRRLLTPGELVVDETSNFRRSANVQRQPRQPTPPLERLTGRSRCCRASPRCPASPSGPIRTLNPPRITTRMRRPLEPRHCRA
jgi:hypothetical protein